MLLEWKQADDGVITVSARASDGRVADVADFWLRPMIESFGMTKADAKEWQAQFADLLVRSYNRHFCVTPGGFATLAPPEASIAAAPDGAAVKPQEPQ